MAEKVERAARAGFTRWSAEHSCVTPWDAVRIEVKDRWRRIAMAMLASLEV